LNKYQSPKYLLLGEVLRPHGILGELRVRVMTDYPERIPDLEFVYLGKSPNTTTAKQYRVRHMRMHKGYALLKLETIDDRNKAELLRKLLVMVPIADAVPLEDDEIYLFQLIGMSVQTEDGEMLGKIIDVLETGANDVYIVRGEAYGEVLIPVIDETILETNVADGVVIVHLPDGLLPD
jgi:16S rRNA processing protein RimM